MLPEISLHVLDTAENSVRAGAAFVEIEVAVSTAEDSLSITIKDNGSGMDPEQVQRVTDPFFTTRTTRKVGLGVPFFKQATEISGGSFQITSEKGKGTVLTARFVLSSIDRMPLGDMSMTVHNLMVYHEEVDFRYRYACDGREFVLDTREMKEMLGDVPLHSPEVSAFIMDYLKENHREVSGGKNL